jgi:tetratricopeptide (TPR) repeat protein
VLVGLFCLAVMLAGVYLLIAPAEDAGLRAAQAEIAKRDFAAALRLLNERLEQHPGDLSARIMAVQAARRNADYDQARQHMRVFELSDGPPLALELEQRLFAVQTGDPAEAALVDEFCRAQPDSSEFPLALEALIIGDLGKLTRPLESPDPLSLDDQPPELRRLLASVDVWLEKRPATADQVQGLVWRGRARRLAGDHPGAVADLQRALELDENHFEARAYLALIIAQDQPLESIAHFELLRQRHPNDIRLVYAIATASRSVGDWDRARDSLDEILRTHPRNAQVLLERARLALDEREPAAAKAFLDRAAAAGANNAQLHLVFARCMSMLGDPAAAKEHQEQFLKLDAKKQSQGNKKASQP